TGILTDDDKTQIAKPQALQPQQPPTQYQPNTTQVVQPPQYQPNTAQPAQPAAASPSWLTAEAPAPVAPPPPPSPTQVQPQVQQVCWGARCRSAACSRSSSRQYCYAAGKYPHAGNALNAGYPKIYQSRTAQFRNRGMPTSDRYGSAISGCSPGALRDLCPSGQ